MSQKQALEFAVDPHWRFLRENYGMEEAFAYFGPYRGASIFPRVLDKNTIEVRMPLVPSNRNYVGTQFGGSLYSMADPFYMFILMDNLGDDYIVWDRSASIDFLRPGRGEVVVRFHISSEKIEELRERVDRDRKLTETFETDILGEKGEVVAHIKKEIYIRRRRH